jgi:iron(III) transport system permease protein
MKVARSRDEEVVDVPSTASAASPEDRLPRGRPRLIHRGLINTLAVGLVAYLVLGPLLMLIWASIQDASMGIRVLPPVDFTLINFQRVFGDPDTYKHIIATGVFAGGSLLFAYTVSIAVAWLVERTDLPFRNVLYVIVAAPLGIPQVVMVIAWTLMLNPTNGVINVTLRDVLGLDVTRGPFNVYSMAGMIFVQGMNLVPLTLLLISPTLAGMSASFEAAARASGAGYWTVMRRIVLPLWKPALLGALIYQVVTVVDTIDVPLLIGLPGGVSVFMTDVYKAINPIDGISDYGAASTFALVVVAFSVFAMVLYNRVINSASSYATITGKSFRPSRFQLGRWRGLAFTLTLGYALLSVVLPLGVLVWVSFQPFMGPISIDNLGLATTETYRKVLLGEGDRGGWNDLFVQSLKNTLVIGLASATAVVSLSLVLSWMVVRSRSRYRGAVDALAFLGHAIPGAIVAIAVLLIYLLLPNPIYGTVWVVVIAMVAKYISLGTRGTTAGIAQIQVSLEEAAATSGANAWQMWRKVLVPLLAPTLASSFLVVFLAAITILSIPLFLLSGQNYTLAFLIFDQWDRGRATVTAVLCVVVATGTIGLTGVLRFIGNRRGFHL